MRLGLVVLLIFFINNDLVKFLGGGVGKFILNFLLIVWIKFLGFLLILLILFIKYFFENCW